MFGVPSSNGGFCTLVLEFASYKEYLLKFAIVKSQMLTKSKIQLVLTQLFQRVTVNILRFRHSDSWLQSKQTKSVFVTLNCFTAFADVNFNDVFNTQT